MPLHACWLLRCIRGELLMLLVLSFIAYLACLAGAAGTATPEPPWPVRCFPRGVCDRVRCLGKFGGSCWSRWSGSRSQSSHRCCGHRPATVPAWSGHGERERESEGEGWHAGPACQCQRASERAGPCWAAREGASEHARESASARVGRAFTGPSWERRVEAARDEVFVFLFQKCE
jgi:hypothetical protein